MCINTAIHLGCNPIIFIGQDLAYTNDKVHANFCEFTNDKYKGEEILENIKRDSDIFIDDIYGKKVRTSVILNAFKENIEEIIKVKCDKLIDLNKKLKIKYNKKQLNEYDKISAKMDVLEEELKKLYLKVNYIKGLIYPLVMKVELNNDWIIKNSDNEREKFKKLYNKTEFLYSTMKKKVEYALDFIDKQWNINELN